MSTLAGAAGNGQGIDASAPAGTTLYKTYNSGAGGGTKVQVSTDGNLVGFESPVGYEHLGVGTFSDGYVLCYTTPAGADVAAYDAGSSSSGLGASTQSGDTVTRTTNDGVLRLKQVFSFNGPAKSISVAMTVTNLLGAGSVSNVILRRQTDLDVDTGGTNGWASFSNLFAATSRDGVWAWNDPSAAPAGKESHSLMLRDVDPSATGVPHVAKVTEDILDTSCSPTAKATPVTTPSDDGATIQYNVGKIGHGVAKTVKLMIARQ